MSEFFGEISRPATLAFALSTMFGMGLGLTVGQIVKPLRSWRLLVAALTVNFVVVPVAGLLLAGAIALGDDIRTGLLLVACAAGAPLVPKFVEIAKGDVATGVALVAVLIVATVAFFPVALPLILPDVDVDVGAISLALGWQMLLPLAIGLLVRRRYEEEAAAFRPAVGIVSNISVVILFVATVGQNVSGVIDLFGTGGIAAGLVLIAVAAVGGYLSGVPARVERRVMSLSAGQRNLAAAFIVANANFADRPTVLIYIAATGVLMMVILFPLAGEFSRRPRGAHLADQHQPRSEATSRS